MLGGACSLRGHFLNIGAAVVLGQWTMCPGVFGCPQEHSATDIETAPLSEYSSLFMSCQQVKYEMEYEVLRLLHLYLKYKLSTTPSIQIRMPKTFKEASNLRIFLSTKVWFYCLWQHRQAARYVCTCAEQREGLQWAFGLHLDSLTFAYYEEDGVPYNGLNQYFLIINTVFEAERKDSVIKSKSLVLDLSQVAEAIEPSE